MSSPTDPRRTVGTTVCTRARLVTSIPQCRRLFGAAHKTEEVPGVFLSVESKKTNKRSVTYVVADWTLPSGTKRASVNLASVKVQPDQTAPVPPEEPSRTAANATETPQTRDASPGPSAPASGVTAASPDTEAQNNAQSNERARTAEPISAAYGREWHERDVTSPMNGSIPIRSWSVRRHNGDILSFVNAPRDMKPIDLFLIMFPPEHLVKIVDAPSTRLCARAFKPTTTG